MSGLFFCVKKIRSKKNNIFCTSRIKFSEFELKVPIEYEKAAESSVLRRKNNPEVNVIIVCFCANCVFVGFYMTKRMLIDDTRQEETRVVVLDGNKLVDVEFESENRKQIKGNVYLAKVTRIEPSLQAAFVDYGGNKHGFLPFSEIHPDYYDISPEIVAAVEKEVDEIIESKKQQIRERELRREQSRLQYEAEKKARLEAESAAKAAEEEAQAAAEIAVSEQEASEDGAKADNSENNTPSDAGDNTRDDKKVKRSRRLRKKIDAKNAEKNLDNIAVEEAVTETVSNTDSEPAENTDQTDAKEEDPADAPKKKRHYTRRKKADTDDEAPKDDKTELKVLSEKSVLNEDEICENINSGSYDDDDQLDDDDEDPLDDFEIQRKLLKLRKLYYNSTIQDVIKEGQVLLVQVVKEERGNKGAAMTTYLSLAGKYGVLMPNRIKSGGVSRKITSAADRKRLKDIVKSLPLPVEMSMIIRTAGEEKTRQDITRDYNYLIRTWNQIRLSALKTKVPSLIHEEGNLIKRALRDMYTKDVNEVLIDGEKAYQLARDFVKIYAPNQLKKIKISRHDDIPLFQRFQVENQLDKLHNPIVQLESGGYLVINPTEALVSIDVNSGRATKEKDIEETALNTNLEAADEIARQLRMRNLAGLVVVDFIDMEEPQNNHAVEKRMKEAMKADRARVQIAKMSCFGLLEISRQRMHSSFLESNYMPCPHCHGTGVVRTAEIAGTYILREIEEQGIKNRFSRLNVSLPYDTALYLLNQKKKNLCELEEKYGMEIVIIADNAIKNVSDYKLERIKITRPKTEPEKPQDEVNDEAQDDDLAEDIEIKEEEKSSERHGRHRRDRRNRFDRRNRRQNNNYQNQQLEKAEAEMSNDNQEQPKRKLGWWRRLIGGE